MSIVKMLQSLYTFRPTMRKKTNNMPRAEVSKRWQDPFPTQSVDHRQRRRRLVRKPCADKLFDSRWHHVAATWSGKDCTLRCYVDGEQLPLVVGYYGQVTQGSSVKKDDHIVLAMGGGEASRNGWWDGVPGSKLSFSRGNKFIVHEVKAPPYRTNHCGVRFAALKAWNIAAARARVVVVTWIAILTMRRTTQQRQSFAACAAGRATP